MNIKRGLFRLWVVFAGLWAIAVVLIAWEGIKTPYVHEAEYLYYPDTDLFHLAPGSFSRYSEEMTAPYRKMEFTGFKTLLYIPRTVVAQEERYEELAERFSKEILPAELEKIDARRWANAWQALMMATIPSLAILALGYALVWAFTGFRQTPLA